MGLIATIAEHTIIRAADAVEGKIRGAIPAKPLSKMTSLELRTKARLARHKAAQLEKNLGKAQEEKKALFQKGANADKGLRTTIARQIDSKTTEITELVRDANTAMQEATFISKMATAKTHKTEKRVVQTRDVVALERMSARDSVKDESYREMLDESLRAVNDIEVAGTSEPDLGEAGDDAMREWAAMERIEPEMADITADETNAVKAPVRN